MRTHEAIITDAGGPKAVHERHQIGGSVHTVTSWHQRKRIPAEHWKAFAEAGLTTLDELASAVAGRRSATRDEAA